MIYKEVISAIFSLGLFINAVSFIPQIVRIVRERSTRGISLITFSIFLITQFSAVLYGFIIHSWILITGYILSMLTCGPVVILILYFRHKHTDYCENNTNVPGVDFKDIIRQSPVHIYWKDLEGRSLGCSDQQYKSLGLNSRCDYIGKTDFELFPEDQAEKIVDADKSVIKSGKDQVIEELANTGEGTQALYLSHKVPLKNNQGKTVGLVGVSMDITDARRKELERKEFLENIIALMPGHVYWVNRQGIYQGCNDEQARSAGLKSREEIIGKQNAELPWNLHSNVVPELIDKVNDEIMASGQSKVIEEPATLDDGTTKTFLSSKVPLKNHEGEVIGLLGISVDISDRKTMENELVIAKERAEVANKAKEEFLYNMRHDIRTPFSGITGMTTLLKETETDKEKLQYINNIAISAEQLLDYLNTILEFTQSDEGSIPVVSKQINLKNCIQSCVDMFKPSIESEHIKFIYTYNKALSSEYLTDEFRIQRIIINLLGNAIKFTPRNGSIKLMVSLVEDKFDKKDPLIQITVQDSGIGIPAGKEAIIFEKFERLTSSYKGKYKGTGLGLYAVKTLIYDLNGSVKVFSEAGEGATFTCTIPMKQPKSGVQAPSSKEICSTEQCDNFFFSEAPEVLLVEDGDIMQLAATTLLESLNCLVEVADTGERAVECCHTKIYDLIFMDIGLPGIDGYEATRQIRQINNLKDVPIVALTAHATDEVDDECQDSGMNDVVSKPITKTKAAAILNQYICKYNVVDDSVSSPIKVADYSYLDAAIINMKDSIIKRGSEQDALHYIFMLKDSLLLSLKTISQLLNEDDYVQLGKEVHKLKGALSLVTLPTLQQTLEKIDQHIKKKNDKSIQLLYSVFKLESDLFIEEVEKLPAHTP